MMMKMIKYIFACLLLTLPAHPVFADTGEWGVADQVKARLLSGVESIAPDQRILSAAIEKQLSPGWHTYWRSPGESGLPPRFDWSGSENIAGVDIAFPFPKRYKELDLTVYGYDGRVVFPMDVTLKEAGKAATVRMKMDTLVCKDICIPQSVEMALGIPAGDGMQSASTRLIEAAMDKIPVKENTPTLQIQNIIAGPAGLVVTAYAQRGFDRADVFIELPDYALAGAPRIEETGQDNTAMLIVPAPEGIDDFAAYLQQKEIRITLTDGRQAVEKMIQY